MYERGLVAGPDGNVSVRLTDDAILVTPSGFSKVDVTPDDLVLVNARGAVIDDASRARDARRPSSELGMHLRLYALRADVRAVVHAHPPAATAFAVAGESFMAPVLPEVILQMGGVPLVPYATPGTPAVADALAPFVAGHVAFLLANHGATTMGATLAVAHQRMESLEHAARILLAARSLGRVNGLSVHDVEQLQAVAARAAAPAGDNAGGAENE
jgi:L-fuculose-phosphate aldolase